MACRPLDCSPIGGNIGKRERDAFLNGNASLLIIKFLSPLLPSASPSFVSRLHRHAIAGAPLTGQRSRSRGCRPAGLLSRLRRRSPGATGLALCGIGFGLIWGLLRLRRNGSGILVCSAALLGFRPVGAEIPELLGTIRILPFRAG